MADAASSSAGRDANDYGRFDFEDPEAVAAAWGASTGKPDDEQMKAMQAMSGCNHDKSSEIAIYELPIDEKVRRIRKYHERGNAYFDEGQYARAAAQYRSANVIYDYTFPEDEATWAVIDGLRKVCNLNAAACNTKIGSYDDALQNCYEVLRAEPTNVKALFRRARVHRHRDAFDEARRDLRAALKLLPHDYQLREEYAVLKAQVAAYTAKQKAMAARMLGGGAAETDKDQEEEEENSSSNSGGGNGGEKKGSGRDAAVQSRQNLLLPPRPPPPSDRPVVDDLYEPTLFDTTPIDDDDDDDDDNDDDVYFGDCGDGDEYIADAYAGGQLSADGHIYAGGEVAGAEEEGAASAEALLAPTPALLAGPVGTFVFGDLNRPGAFVPRRRQKTTDTAQSVSCLCCV
jgi:tetratricopeptide (TPR) repeat protein